MVDAAAGKVKEVLRQRRQAKQQEQRSGDSGDDGNDDEDDVVVVAKMVRLSYNLILPASPFTFDVLLAPCSSIFYLYCRQLSFFFTRFGFYSAGLD